MRSWLPTFLRPLLILVLLGVGVLSSAAPAAAQLPSSTVTLNQGCTDVVLSFSNGTSIRTVVAAVSPSEALKAIWRANRATGQDDGFSPRAALRLSELSSVNRLDRVRICMETAGLLTQPAS